MRDVDVGTRTRGDDDALRWTAVGTLAVVALVCSFLPAAHLEVSGFIGAGETERVYNVQRDVALVPDLLPRSLVVVAVVLMATRFSGFLGSGSTSESIPPPAALGDRAPETPAAPAPRARSG